MRRGGSHDLERLAKLAKRRNVLFLELFCLAARLIVGKFAAAPRSTIGNRLFIFGGTSSWTVVISCVVVSQVA